LTNKQELKAGGFCSVGDYEDSHGAMWGAERKGASAGLFRTSTEEDIAGTLWLIDSLGM
jgi:hypothetical protein